MVRGTILEPEIHKIVGLTSTMRPEITMTIKVEVNFSPDLSVSDEVMHVQVEEKFRWKSISAASFSIAGRNESELHALLLCLWDALIITNSSCDFWLCIGNNAWQPDDRIVRYRKLWKALRSKDIDFQEQCKSKEHCIESESGVKYFGAIKLEKETLDSMTKAFLYDKCMYIVVLPTDVNIDDVIASGWVGTLNMDIDFIGKVLASSGCVLKKTGEFDDREQGFILMGNTKVENVAKILSVGIALK